jgi:ubiquitin-activating enzyme E1
VFAGPRKISIVDDSLVEDTDRTFNWFYKEASVGQTRAHSVVQMLAQLNENVEVDTLSARNLDESTLKKYQLFYLTDCLDRIAIEGWNELCRKNDLGMVLVNVIGGFSFLFVDLSPAHRTEDKYLNSKKRQYYVKNITNAKPGVVELYQIGDPPQYAAGDFVSFTGVEGMTEVNGAEARPIRPITDFSFSIEPTTSFQQYTNGGLVTYEKVPVSLRFASFKENLVKPRLLKHDDGYKGNSQLELHIAMAIYLELKDEVEGQVSILADLSIEEEIVQSISDVVSTRAYIKKLIAENQLSGSKIKKIALQLVTVRMDQNLAAVSIIAGLAAFQIMPFNGKMLPFNQFIFYDLFEDLPNSLIDTIGHCLGMEPLYVHLQNFKQVNPQIVDHLNSR